MTPDKSLIDIKEFEHSMFRTPDLYFGYKFAQNRNQLGSEEGFQPGKTTSYLEPTNIELHKFYSVEIGKIMKIVWNYLQIQVL